MNKIDFVNPAGTGPSTHDAFIDVHLAAIGVSVVLLLAGSLQRVTGVGLAYPTTVACSVFLSLWIVWRLAAARATGPAPIEAVGRITCIGNRTDFEAAGGFPSAPVPFEPREFRLWLGCIKGTPWSAADLVFTLTFAGAALWLAYGMNGSLLWGGGGSGVTAFAFLCAGTFTAQAVAGLLCPIWLMVSPGYVQVTRLTLLSRRTQWSMHISLSDASTTVNARTWLVTLRTDRTLRFSIRLQTNRLEIAHAILLAAVTAPPVAEQPGS